MNAPQVIAVGLVASSWLLSVAFVLVLALRLKRGTLKAAKPGSAKFLTLAALLALLGCMVALRSSKETSELVLQRLHIGGTPAPADTASSSEPDAVQPVSGKPLTPAATFVVHFIKTGKYTRQDMAKNTHAERGPEDSPLSDNKDMAAAEVEAACQVVQALTDGDLAQLQAIIAAYKQKPYARAQIAECLNYAFTLLDIDYRFVHAEMWFFVEPEKKADGRLTLAFSPFEKKTEGEAKPVDGGKPYVAVLRTTEDKKEPGLFHLDTDESADAAAVLKQFQKEILAAASRKQENQGKQSPQR
jgi:hypothetical protein